MDKWGYIQQISACSNKQGDLLIRMMELYNKNNLQDITLEEAKFFCEMLDNN